MWLWVENRVTPKWNPGKWKHGLKSAGPGWSNFDSCPYRAGVFMTALLGVVEEIATEGAPVILFWVFI